MLNATKLRKTSNILGFFLFAILGGPILTGFIIKFINSLTKVSFLENMTLMQINIIGIIIGELFFLCTVPRLLNVKINDPELPSYHSKYIFSGFAITTFLTSIILLIIIYLDFLFFRGIISSTVPDISTKNMNIIAEIFMLSYLIFIAPILEELIFRGLILNSLKIYGKWFAIIISSILFGILHINFIQTFNAFVMGIILGTIAIKTNSLIPSILIHILNNGWKVIILNILPKFNLSEAMIEKITLLITIILCLYATIFLIKILSKKFNNIKYYIKNVAVKKYILFFTSPMMSIYIILSILSIIFTIIGIARES